LRGQKEQGGGAPKQQEQRQVMPQPLVVKIEEVGLDLPHVSFLLFILFLIYFSIFYFQNN